MIGKSHGWISFLVLFCMSSWITFFLCRHRFFLFPLSYIMETPSEFAVYEEYHFDNEMGAWVYPPLQAQEESGAREKILVYFNGNAGNVSVRVIMLRTLQHLFPGFKIYHLEYPGFGISDHLACDWETIIDKCTEACESIHRQHQIETLVFWGESMGALIQAHVCQRWNTEVHWIFQANGVNDLQNVIGQYCPALLQGFVLPFVPISQQTADIYQTCFIMPTFRNTKVCCLHARDDDIVPITQSYSLFSTLFPLHPSRVFFVELQGKHNLILACKENQKRIKDFLQSHSLV